MIPEYIPPQRKVECTGKVDAGLLKLLRGRVTFEAAGYDKDGKWYHFEHALCTRYEMEHGTGDLHYMLSEVHMIEKQKVPARIWIDKRANELMDEFYRTWPRAPTPRQEVFLVQALIDYLDEVKP